MIKTPPDLDYRIAKDADLPLLLQYRRECGWGEAPVKKNWTDPDRIYCVFEATIEGNKQDVGMGCWYLHQPDDLELACREKNVVHLASLFIQHKYQGLGLGSRALRLLEQVAVDRYNAKSVTLDTLAYHTTESPCRTYFIEDASVTGRNVVWYTSKGYSQFRPVGPLYHIPTPNDPEFRLTAAFMDKSADAIRAT